MKIICNLYMQYKTVTLIQCSNDLNHRSALLEQGYYSYHEKLLIKEPTILFVKLNKKDSINKLIYVVVDLN